MHTSFARIVAAVACFLAIKTAAAAEDASREVWRHDFDSAEREAQRRDVPLLVHFHAKWCGPCRQMERDVLQDPTLLVQLREGLVAVKVDSDERPDVVQRFGIQSLPSDLFLDPKGLILDRATGYRDRQTYLAAVARVEARASQLRAAHIALQTKSPAIDPASPRAKASLEAPSPLLSRANSGTTPQFAAPSPRATSVPPGRMPSSKHWLSLGLRGFSPVALVTNRRWVRGDERLTFEYKGIVYRMASVEELKRFKDSPDRYAPQVLGCDPVVLEITDRAVQGDIRYAAFYDDELYLFVSDKSREAFKQDPDRFVRTKHVLNVDELNDKRLE